MGVAVPYWSTHDRKEKDVCTSLVLPDAAEHGNCAVFLLLDLLSWTSAKSSLFSFLAFFKMMLVQRACSVRKQQYGKMILYLLSSARKKNTWVYLHFLVLVTLPNYLKQSNYSISTYPSLITAELSQATWNMGLRHEFQCQHSASRWWEWEGGAVTVSAKAFWWKCW